MNQEDVMLSEISQTQKDKYSVISLICGSTDVEFIKAESRMVVVRGLGMEEMGRCG